jgi:deoxyribodipyrimidine photo-lyase
MTSKTAILWFRQDLRLSDNPALHEAAKSGHNILPVFILDDENAGRWKMGGASRFWLHHSLQSLNDSLDENLLLLKGDAAKLLPDLAKETDATAAYWNRCYEPWRIDRDRKIKKTLTDLGIETHSCNGSLLWEPWDVVKDDGTPYKVFTPFYKKGCLSKDPPREPLKKSPLPLISSSFPPLAGGRKGGATLEELSLLPRKPVPRWDKKMEAYWHIGEKGAHQRLKEFLEDGLKGYKEGRDFMTKDFTSRLSPHLHFGEISPNQVWYAAKHKGDSGHWNKDTEHFLSELAWREFSYNLLYHFPHLPQKNFQPKFDKFPFVKNDSALLAWQKGQTGYPIVDAAMRQMWEMGYMHNRARMIVGSFLVKDLLIYWEEGEDWFWDCLCDADLASNAASWQWIAGSGADAAPYFRVFNPVTQGEKFDPEGEYVRRFVPELKDLPDKYIHRPWEAPEIVLKGAGIELGKTYPKPVVDHSLARDRALEAFAALKG